jgi:hypothetical protein
MAVKLGQQRSDSICFAIAVALETIPTSSIVDFINNITKLCLDFN